jgi:hypothetical protein
MTEIEKGRHARAVFDLYPGGVTIGRKLKGRQI